MDGMADPVIYMGMWHPPNRDYPMSLRQVDDPDELGGRGGWTVWFLTASTG